MADALEPLKGLFHRVRGTVSRHRLSESSGLHIVREPPNAEIDIVAVHGLGGEGFRSWITLDPKAGKPRSWLEELLGHDVPNARILTYGYVTDGVNYRYLVRNILYGRALDLVKELGAQRTRDGTHRRPIFFIAHSLGGWIVKRGLIISKESIDSHLRDVELSTCGVAFFGTLSPGRPSSPSPLGSVIRRTSFPLNENPRRAQTFQVDANQDANDEVWLENQMEGFKAITANLPRLSFYETKRSRDGFVVEKRHSLVGSDGLQVPLTSTHADLVKFRGRDPNYTQFLTKFREMVDVSRNSGILEKKRKEYELSAVHRPEYLDKDFSLPYQHVPDLGPIVPREELMSQLEDILQPSNALNNLRVRIAVCWGAAGTGKTMLARHYAETHRNDTSIVFWVQAESWESVVASYLQFAQQLVGHYAAHAPKADVETHLGLRGVDEMLKASSILHLDILRVKSVVQAVKNWLLRPNNDKWLLIFDHAESSFDIFDFIPLTRTGRIILTSRDSECCSWGTRMKISAMTEDQALALLMQTLSAEPLKDPIQDQAARDTVRHLAYHPQSIAVTASTIRRKGIDVVRYAKTLELHTVVQAEPPRPQMSPFAMLILQLSSLLGPTNIPSAIFMVNMTIVAPPSFQSTLNTMTAVQESGQFNDILQELFTKDLIQTPSPTTDSAPASQSSSQPLTQSSSESISLIESFILEPTVRTKTRDDLNDESRVAYAWLICQLCVAAIRQKEAESLSLPDIHNFARTMGPHAKACYDDWAGLLRESASAASISWFVLGRVCMFQGAVEQAIGCFELSLEHESDLAPLEKIQISLWLASILRKNGQPDKSRKVLDRIDARFIDQSVGFRVAKAKASAAAAEGELARAEDSLEMLEQEQAEALGVTSIATVDTVQQLAMTLEKLGKVEEAQALYRRVWLSCQSIFGANHSTTLAALEDLARISLDSHAIDEAENLYQQAVEISTRTLGPQHPNTAQAILKLAIIFDIRSRYGLAKETYEEALKIMEGALGKANPTYTAAAENLALSIRWHAYSLSEDLDKTEVASDGSDDATLRESSPSGQTTRGTESSPNASAQAVAAFEEAERIYLEVLEIKKSARDLYSDSDVFATASKLSEMYENETVFDATRDTKMAELKTLLGGVRRRQGSRGGSMRTLQGMESSLSEMSVEDWR